MNLETKVSPASGVKADRDWWRGAVIYQIYPRSFQDSNGDGIGDLSGIIHRLPYVANLGVDAIWISPFFTSPMLDFGYDVSDYRDVDPMFGTLGDFDALVARAHELGIRVMIDLVMSHTSDQHPWFRESRASQDNAKADWYVWSDPSPDGTPPNNWLAIFGGPAWAWDGERRQYYLHNFLREQPDLNFHNPEVQDALLDMVRFWLDRGVDGFRLDTINFYFHDRQLRSNPALTPQERNATIAPDVNPYNFQNHLYDKNRPENLAFLERFRALLDEYPAAAAVGEVGDAQYGLEIMGQYTEGDKRMHMCYSFDFLSAERPDAARTRKLLGTFQKKVAKGWPCWAFSNHDVERHVSRWGLDQASALAYLGLILSLKGSICLYQGEELGLTEAYVSFEELQDPYGIRFWPKFKGRDGCRTPMVWSSSAANGGFSDGKPWLPVAMEHVSRAVDTQDGAENSLLNAYRRMLSFRAAHPSLVKGAMEILDSGEQTVCLIRSHSGEGRIFFAVNLSRETAQVELPKGEWKDLKGHVFAPEREGARVTLPPWQAYYASEIREGDGT
ncbi:MAG: alpha-glucosidase [Paracoccaceae bacterium]